MEQLTLHRIGRDDKAFLQYLPENMWKLLEWEETICVGAVFRGMSCAVALAEKGSGSEYYLRYIFVDPTARLCGLGTHLLRGLLGEVAATGVRYFKAIYSPSMLEKGGSRLGILERAGFSRPKPVATSFSVTLGEIRDVTVTLPENMTIYSAAELPEELSDEYEALVLDGELPQFMDARNMEEPLPEVSTFCVVDGRLGGMILIDQQEDGLHVTGLYVMEHCRRGRTAAALISAAVRAAKESFPPETEVTASAINRDSFSLCEKILRAGDSKKETELLSVFEF